MLRGRPLVNRCCMCCCDGESVDNLLLHCPVTHTLWTFMLQAFGIHWVMLGSVAGLLSCWHQWLGKHNSNIWNLIPGCLMWIVWLGRNRRSFENMEKTLDELKVLCQCSLFGWARCWGFTDSSSLSKFMFSLRLSFWFPFILFYYLFLLFLVVHHHEQLVLFLFLSHHKMLHLERASSQPQQLANHSQTQHHLWEILATIVYACDLNTN